MEGRCPSWPESESTHDEFRQLRVARCLSLLEDSIPLEVKEEARGKPTSEGLRQFIWVVISISSSSVGLSWYWLSIEDENLLNYDL